MQQPVKRVLIMAGGTGGHIFPGLAIARYLKEKDIEVHWLGTTAGLEARLVPDAGIPLHFIEVKGLRGKGISSLLSAPFRLITALAQARKVMKAVQPDRVIGMGGFVSGPGGVAAWLMNYPLIIHEQNAKAGLTNRLLAPFSKYILEGFPGAFKSRRNVLTVGNPVRADIEALPSPNARSHTAVKPMRLLVLGGSLGAQVLNQTVPQVLAMLSPTDRPIVLHQTGEKHWEETRKTYEALGIEAEVVPFIKEMGATYGSVDLVLCRAGALTVAELCAAGLGAIFVPYPHAVDDHQTANAQFMVCKQAALCLPQAQLEVAKLAELIRQFNADPGKRLKMAEAAYQLRHSQVPAKIFDILSQVS